MKTSTGSPDTVDAVSIHGVDAPGAARATPRDCKREQVCLKAASKNAVSPPRDVTSLHAAHASQGKAKGVSRLSHACATTRTLYSTPSAHDDKGGQHERTDKRGEWERSCVERQLPCAPALLFFCELLYIGLLSLRCGQRQLEDLRVEWLLPARGTPRTPGTLHALCVAFSPRRKIGVGGGYPFDFSGSGDTPSVARRSTRSLPKMLWPWSRGLGFVTSTCHMHAACAYSPFTLGRSPGPRQLD